MHNHHNWPCELFFLMAGLTAKAIFPQMSVSDVTNALNGWHLQVSQAQLLHPTAEVVEPVYRACLQQVTNLNYENLTDPLQTVLSGSVADEKVSGVVTAWPSFCSCRPGSVCDSPHK